jgi:hypothetical protein
VTKKPLRITITLPAAELEDSSNLLSTDRAASITSIQRINSVSDDAAIAQDDLDAPATGFARSLMICGPGGITVRCH